MIECSKWQVVSGERKRPPKMNENFEQDFSRFKREREKRKEKGTREPLELKKIPTFSELSPEETRFQREEIEKLLQEKDPLKKKLGVGMAFLLDLETREELFSKYSKGMDRETWIWIREALEDELGEEAQKFLEKIFPPEIRREMTRWEENQKIVLPAASLAGILRAAAKGEEEEAEEERKILGQVYLRDLQGVLHTTLYYEKKSRPGQLNLPFTGEKISVVFDGQRDKETPYAIPEDGWFSPRDEDRELFEGEIRGRVVDQ